MLISLCRQAYNGSGLVTACQASHGVLEASAGIHGVLTGAVTGLLQVVADGSWLLVSKRDKAGPQALRAPISFAINMKLQFNEDSGSIYNEDTHI